MRLGIVAEKLGDDKEAARHYREAIRHADLVGDRQARALAVENLESVDGGG
jgi:hypothetical protein